MEKVIADILPYGVAVAFSPMPIAALLLMLLSKKAKANSVSFSIGWIIGLALLVFVVSSLVTATTGDKPTELKKIIDLLIGVLLLALAVKEWKQRTKPGATPQMPKWMEEVESFTPIKALAIGLALSTLNFKNTPLGITVGTTLTKYSPENQIIGFISYLFIASSLVVIPTIGFLIFGEKLQTSLQSLKNWLVQNNATIMFVLFLILGTVILSKSLS